MGMPFPIKGFYQLQFLKLRGSNSIEMTDGVRKD